MVLNESKTIIQSLEQSKLVKKVFQGEKVIVENKDSTQIIFPYRGLISKTINYLISDFRSLHSRYDIQFLSSRKGQVR